MSEIEYRPMGSVGHLVLNNPARRNALNPAMLVGIGEALDAFQSDTDARVLIVRGEGPSFCAGIDVGSGGRYGDGSASDDHQRLLGMAALWLRFFDSPKPVIAQIHGYCLAGALQLPLCCDIVVVAENAVIGGPKLPMGAGWIGPMLAARIGAQRAKLLLFQLGFEMSGREAYEAGFAAVVTADADLAETTETLARRIAAVPADLLRTEKMSINATAAMVAFRSEVQSGTLWDALSHTSAGVREAKQIVSEHGVKAAVAEYAQRSAGGTGSAK